MNIILLGQLLFAGYFKDLDGITPALRWLRWLSAFYYAFESLVVNEISGLAFEFSVSLFADRNILSGSLCAS